MAELQPFIVFHSHHFVRHLGICNLICVNVLQLMSRVIMHNSVKKRSLHINKWLSYSQIVFQGRHFVRHIWICNRICVKLLQVMSGVIPRNLKKTTSLSQTVFMVSTNATYTHTHTHTPTHTHTHTQTYTHNRHTQTHTHTHTNTNTHIHNTHTPIHTDRQTHTHDDSIRRNAMRCISPNYTLKSSYYGAIAKIEKLFV